MRFAERTPSEGSCQESFARLASPVCRGLARHPGRQVRPQAPNETGRFVSVRLGAPQEDTLGGNREGDKLMPTKTSTEAPRRGRPRSERSRRAILRAASELLLERGLSEISM